MIIFIKKIEQGNLTENDQGKEVLFKLGDHEKCLWEVPFEMKSEQ